MLWFHCDDTTGAIITGGISPTKESAQLNLAPEGQSLFVVPDATVTNIMSGSPDLSPLKLYVADQINASYSAFLAPQVTNDVPLHDLAVSRKQAEAELYTAGDETAHPERYPFLLSEVAAKNAVGISTTFADVLAGIEAQVAQAAAIPVLEGYRVALRAKVAAGTTIPEIVTGLSVNWADFIA